MRRNKVLCILFLAAFFGLPLSTSAAQDSTSTPTQTQRTLVARVVGHRGHSSIQPENTIPSVLQCIETGANGCECDLQWTKDGKIVLFHDARTDSKVRDAEGRPVKGEIVDFTLEELRSFDVGIWKGEKFRGTKIATLDEYLDAFKDSSCIPVIELKKSGLEEAAAAAVKARGLEKRCIFISGSRKIKELCPEITTAILMGTCDNVPDEELADYIENAVKAGNTNMVDIEHSRMTPELAKELKKRGIFIMVWTVKHDPQRLQELYKMGVDSITTDYPDEALSAVKEAAQ